VASGRAACLPRRPAELRYVPGRRAPAHEREMSTERTRRPVPQQWAIWLAIEGDLRFLSHHEMMRTVERLVARAQLPVRYSQGFNPRPKISLASARPVGVAAAGDLLSLSLDLPVEAEKLLRELNGHAPKGMRFLQAEVLPTRSAPRLTATDYQLELTPAKADAVRERLARLRCEEAWPVERRVTPKRRDRAELTAAKRTIDLKPLLASVSLQATTLRVTLCPAGQTWARPGEVLRLLGLDEQGDLAKTVRTHAAYEF